jgi:hypothetical protein
MNLSPRKRVSAAILAAFGLSSFACLGRQDLDAVATQFPSGSVRGVVEALASIDPPRNSDHPESLKRAAQFIAHRMEEAGLKAEVQPFKVGAAEYYNVAATIGSGSRKRIVVGAHYDVYGPNQADDNAWASRHFSIASKLATQTLPTDVELVAYFEEPPHFETAAMGSAHHAQALARGGVEVVAMLALDMLGFYSDKPKSQQYPDPRLASYFPSSGNFVAVLGLSDDAVLLDRIRSAMSPATDLRVYALSGPPELPGIKQSDHLNYWRQGIPAVLVTDTAYFRNPHYHQASDRPDTLDYDRLHKAAEAVAAAVVDLRLIRRGRTRLIWWWIWLVAGDLNSSHHPSTSHPNHVARSANCGNSRRLEPGRLRGNECVLHGKPGSSSSAPMGMP